MRPLVALAVVLMLPLAASADDRGRAQALFVEAGEARDDGRWEDARRLLEESLTVYPHFPTAWNLVAALEATDDLPAAERLLERMLEGDFGTLETAERGSVTERLEAVGAQLGTVVINVPPDVGATIAVGDAEPVAADASGRLVLRLPAGATRIRASAGASSETREVHVVAAETRTVRFQLGAALGPAAPARVEDDEDSGSLWTSPWLWITVGILVAGGAVATALVLGSDSGEPAPADFMTPPL